MGGFVTTISPSRQTMDLPKGRRRSSSVANCGMEAHSAQMALTAANMAGALQGQHRCMICRVRSWSR
jgi:hypothetical protein